MLRVTLEQWRMFLAVVEHGGFNQASKVIHKSQSSIHHAVSKLEASLKVKLFRVNGRKLELTQQGLTLKRRAEYLLSEANKLEQVSLTLASGVEAEIRVAVDGTFPHELLYSALDLLSMKYPQVRLELVETVLSGALELLSEGSVDIAVGSIPHKGGWNERLLEIDFIPVSSPDHPLQQCEKPIRHEDLKTWRQIVVRDSARHINSDSGWLEAEQRWTVSQLSTSTRLISEGLGFAWLPISYIEPLLKTGALKRLPLGDGANRQMPLYLSSVDKDSLGPVTQELADLLIAQCQGYQKSTTTGAGGQ